MATSATTGLALPSPGRTLDWWGGRLQRFLLRDRTLGYLFLLPAIVVILGLIAYPNAWLAQG